MLVPVSIAHALQSSLKWKRPCATLWSGRRRRRTEMPIISYFLHTFVRTTQIFLEKYIFICAVITEKLNFYEIYLKLPQAEIIHDKYNFGYMPTFSVIWNIVKGKVLGCCFFFFTNTITNFCLKLTFLSQRIGISVRRRRRRWRSRSSAKPCSHACRLSIGLTLSQLSDF